MATTTPILKSRSCKVVLGILLLSTMTSSLGVQPVSHIVERQRQRQPIINTLSTDRFGKTSHVASSPSWHRLFLGSGVSRISPASTAFRHSNSDFHVAERTQLPVKRRWNSGNLRVWGKRSSAALPADSSDSRGQKDGRLVEKVPVWLLPERASNNEQAPAYSEASVSRTSVKPNERSRLWGRAPLRVWGKRRSEWTKGSNHQQRKNKP